jgi:hypothetical protein
MELRDPLDQFLDKALAEHGEAEPRFGLENRILANLAAERARIAGRRRRWWALGIASTTALVAALVWMGYRTEDSQRRLQAAGETVRTQSAATVVAGLPSRDDAGIRRVTIPASTRHLVRTIRKGSAEQLAESGPTLEQFPSPAPLSEQEKILARYITQYPEHALLIARAQTALEQQDRREESQGTVGSSASPASTH